MRPGPGQSFAEELAELVAEAPNGVELLQACLDDMSELELAALADDWENVWRRPKQTPPPGDWVTWGALTGRGFGKSLANSRLVHREVEEGRAMRVALIAQNEDKCLEVMVHGESGLIAVSPPWFKARFELGRVVWPNGAQAFVYTPEVPKDIFGPEHHLAWASELHAWPTAKREEAFANLRMGLRLGYGRLVWDSNPSRRHPILRELLDDAQVEPELHVVVRGSSLENRLNLTRGKVEEWVRKYGNTQRGREMIYGEQVDEEQGALWQQAWIDDNRRDAPERLRRRVIVVDPAISMRAGTDATGIADVGLGHDGQVYVFADLSRRVPWEEWGELVVRRYFGKRCDCLVLERNRGGDAVVANVRACVAKINREEGTSWRVEVVKAEVVPRHVPGVLYVKEVIGRASKGTRAEPVATHYEAGNVSHVNGAELGGLEDLMTTWVPDSGGESPNAIDAVVYGVLEVADLERDARPVGGRVVKEAAKLQEALAKMTKEQPARRRVDVAALLGGRGGGDRI